MYFVNFRDACVAMSYNVYRRSSLGKGALYLHIEIFIIVCKCNDVISKFLGVKVISTFH